jgi:callose synthase
MYCIWQGGIGVEGNKSWESWWDEEQEHLKHTGIFGRFIECLLAFRFFLFQYGIVYHLHIVEVSKNRSISVCSSHIPLPIVIFPLTWILMLFVDHH